MRYMIACGGTSGHINPAIAIAQELKRRDINTEILFIGTDKTIESDLIPRAGFKMEFIDVSGIKRKRNFAAIKHNIDATLKYFKAKVRMRGIIEKFKPDVVIGTGGYVSAPVMKMACKKHIKTVMHEQNAFAGVVTKMLARQVDIVLLSYPLAKPLDVDSRKVFIVGNPAREDFYNIDREKSREALNLTPSDRLVVSYGGSLGARKLNEAFCVLAKAAAKENLITFYHGASRDYDYVNSELKCMDGNPKIKIFKYIYNMPELMAAADLVVSRSGATTLTELSAVGRASILIPSPTVAENHQYYNAKTFSDKGAAILIEQKDLDGEKLYEIIRDTVFDSEKLNRMSNAAKALGSSDSVMKICDHIESLTDKK